MGPLSAEELLRLAIEEMRRDPQNRERSVAITHAQTALLWQQAAREGSGLLKSAASE